MKRKTQFVQGTICLGDKVDIADPGSKKDVWCRKNDIKIVPGEWVCRYHTKMTWGDDEEVSLSMIYHKGIHKQAPKIKDFRRVGWRIGTDTGLAGYFVDKPDYDDDDWQRFVDETYANGEFAWIKGNWFYTRTGGYDGGFDAYIITDDEGRATALMLRFLE